jgi:hypothetical protein
MRYRIIHSAVRIGIQKCNEKRSETGKNCQHKFQHDDWFSKYGFEEAAD